MNILKGDKIVLMKEWGQMKTVGEVYEVANVLETYVVLRDSKTKIAIGAINIESFYEYFKKPEEIKGWTKWQGFTDSSGNVIGFYRTNHKKVQVRLNDGVRSEACCCKGDEFDLAFGIRLAYKRCTEKALIAESRVHEEILKNLYTKISNNRNSMNKMLNSLYKTETENSDEV